MALQNTFTFIFKDFLIDTDLVYSINLRLMAFLRPNKELVWSGGILVFRFFRAKNSKQRDKNVIYHFGMFCALSLYLVHAKGGT